MNRSVPLSNVAEARLNLTRSINQFAEDVLGKAEASSVKDDLLRTIGTRTWEKQARDTIILLDKTLAEMEEAGGQNVPASRARIINLSIRVGALSADQYRYWRS